MRTLRRATFDDWIRAAGFCGALGITGYLAIGGDPQIKPLAAGALFVLLGQATSYLFRSKQLMPTEDGAPPA